MVEERPKPIVAAPRVRSPTRRRFLRPRRRMAWRSEVRREGGREGRRRG
jgi:hypothetical protein